MKASILGVILIAALAGCDEDSSASASASAAGSSPRGASIVAESGRRVTVHYTGRFPDTGKVFDSSLDRGKPFSFTLGGRQVIPCWEEGVLGMKIGDKKQLVCPPDKA
jgi:FKBP-type peptidyl-prolyl cis-trans isomerase